MRRGVRSPSAPPKKQMVTRTLTVSFLELAVSILGRHKTAKRRRMPPASTPVETGTCWPGTLPRVHPEMVDRGLAQGRSDFATAGVVRLRRGLRRARTPAWAERRRFMDGHLWHYRGVPGRSSAGAPDLSSVARRVVRKSLPLTGRFLEGLKPPGWKHPPLIILQLRS